MLPKTDNELSAAISDVVSLMVSKEPPAMTAENRRVLFRALLHHVTGVPVPEDIKRTGFHGDNLLGAVTKWQANNLSKTECTGLLHKSEAKLQTYTHALQELADAWEKLHIIRVE